jgi:DNA-binding transcriptional regulator YdaS (Cro superfamily)
VTTITGSAAEIIALLGAAGINIPANVNFVVDEAASAANIQTIAAATTGEVSATLLAGERTLDLSTSTASKKHDHIE